jgi:hypothetical protein
MDHFSVVGTKVQIYSYLLTIRIGSVKEIWTVQRDVVGDKKNFPMSSLGRTWL